MKKTKESWQGNKKRGIPELRAEFEYAKSSDETIKIFKKIEARLEEKQLGYDCWAVTLHLHKEGKDHEKIMSYGKRALDIFLHEENCETLGIRKSSLAIGNILHVLGSACFELRRYKECLSYLNWSDRNLSKLLADNDEHVNLVLKGLHNTHGMLYKVKKFMGKHADAIVHARRVLEIDEKFFDDGCIELGKSYKDMSECYFQVGNIKEALPYCLKGLEIYKKHLPGDSMEVTMTRLRLGTMHTVLENFDKAFEQNRLSLSGLKKMGNTFRLIMAEIEGCQLMVNLGRYAEAIEALKPVMSQVEVIINQQAKSDNARNQGIRAITIMVMAKALCGQEKFAEARKYIKTAVRILEKKGFDPLVDGIALIDMSKLYEEMKEYEMAISLMQKALTIPGLPQHKFAKCSLRIFSLVSLIGEEEKRLSFLEEVVQRMKEKFGPKNYHLGFAYAILGRVYMDLGRPDMAQEIYKRGKDVFDVSHGPSDSGNATETFSRDYPRMESDDREIEIHEKLVEGLKELGVSEQDSENATVEMLDMTKWRDFREIAEFHARSLHQSEDSEDISATNSKCGVSDHGKPGR